MCPAGSFSPTTGSANCSNCSAGSFSSSPGSSSCTPCPAGTYSTAVGASSSSTCNNACAAGTYSLAGSSNCTGCAAGTYSVGPVSSCTPTATMVPETVKKLFAAHGSAFVLLASNQVKGWGNNDVGQLGYGDTVNRGETVSSMGSNLGYLNFGTGLTVQDADFGGEHGCAIVGGGTKVRCWGKNSFGSHGTGTSPSYGTALYWIGDAPGEMGNALADVDLGTEFSTGQVTASKISCGNLYTCVLFSNGKAKCWGYDYMGALGQGIIMTRGDEPGEMGDNLAFLDVGVGKTISKISTGDAHACAILNDNTLKCWGYNWYGMVGIGTMDAVTSPTAVNVGGLTLKDIVCGQYHTCAILSDNTLKCWGYNSAGQLGQGHTNHLGDGAGEMGTSLLAINLGTGKTAKKVSMGYEYTCAILSDDTVKCWGQNNAGQLGYGDKVLRGDGPGEMGDALPTVDVGTGRYVVDIECYYASTCAKLDDGSIKCWGLASNGRLGRGVAPGAYGSSTYNVGDEAGEMGSALLVTDIGSATVMSVCPFVGGSANCTNCSAGFYSNVQGASSNATCANQCPAGTYSLAGASSCTPCPLGTYSSQLGASACASCPAGNSTASTGSLYASQCLPSYSRLSTRTVPTVALTGYSTTITGQSFGNGVYTIQCADTYSPICTNAFDMTTTAYWTLYSASGSQLYSGGVYMGTYDLATDGYKGHWATISFPFGMTPQSIKVTGYSTSTFWPKVYRFYGKKVGSSSWEILRDETNAAYTGSDHVGAVTSSPVALYDTFGFEVKQLMGSATGGYVAELGITGIVSEGCPAGMYAIDSTLCIACPAGTSSSAGATSIASCIPCSAGSYATSVGTPSCTLCPAGTFSTATGANSSSVCQSCPAGTFTTMSGASSVQACYSACGAGNYSAAGSTSCSMCPAGSYSSPAGTSCPSPTDPVTVQNTLSCGTLHTCAVISNGSVLCWGGGTSGQLGNGQVPGSQYTPVAATGITNAVQVDAGNSHTCAVLKTGAIMCWGDSASGKLGNGASSGIYSSPVQVTGITKGVAVCTSMSSTCALLSDRTVACWGNALNGVLGNNDITNTVYATPVAVLNLQDAVQIAGADAHYCAMRATGGVVCWGTAGNGRLGNGATSGSYGTPATVTGLTNAIYIDSAGSHTCAVRSDRSVACWGSGADYRLGYSLTLVTDKSTPATVLSVQDIATVFLGNLHSCVVTTGGALSCWGNNGNGQVGIGNYNTPINTPSTVLNVDVGAGVAFASGVFHSCVSLKNSSIICWGNGGSGRLGNGLTATRNTPVIATSVGSQQVPSPTPTCTVVPGPSSCLTCEAGKYSATAGQGVCTACAAGTYSTSANSTSCTPCGAGTYIATTGSNSSGACLPCPAGTYSAGPGASNCTPCATGTYNPNSSATSCISCPVNTYATSTGASSVQQCVASVPFPTVWVSRVMPPASLGCTADATTKTATLTGQAYGNGLYSVDWSSYYNGYNNFKCAFDKSYSQRGMTGQQCYGVDGFCSGSDLNSDGYQGAWVSITMPMSVRPTQIKLVQQYNAMMNTRNYRIYAKNTGMAKWDVLATVTDAVFISSDSSTNYTWSPSDNLPSYNSFAIEVNRIVAGYGAFYVEMALSEIIITGDEPTLGSCSAGTYSFASTTCILCPAGTASSAVGATSNSTCAACPTGSYSQAAGSSACVDCGAGTYSAQQGATSSAACQVCPAGTYSAARSAQCTSCPAGTYSSAGSTQCTTCATGKYSLANSANCTDCPAGTYGSSAGSGNCTACPAGYASSTTGATSNATCAMCTVGRYASAGSSSCAKCPYGTYANGNGTASCMACPANTSTPFVGSTYSKCSPASAPPATYRKYPPAGLQEYSWTLSNMGYGNGLYTILYSTKDARGGTRELKIAFDGNDGIYSGMAEEDAYWGAGGTYSSGSNSAIVPGYSGDWIALQMPDKVAYAYLRLYFSTVMNYRVYGRNSDNLAAGWTLLQEVIGAVYTSNVHLSPTISSSSKYDTLALAVGAVSSANQVQMQELTFYAAAAGSCLAGTFAVDDPTVSLCLACYPSTYSASSGGVGEGSCTQCPAGKYSGAYGASSCTSCPAGYWSTEVAAVDVSTCQSCGAGSASVPGSTSCTSCAPGYYATVGSASCTACPAGSYSTLNGASPSCTVCPAGTYSSQGSASCTPCAAGTASPSANQTSSAACATCPAGYYSTSGSPQCILCPIGSYSTAPSASQCTSCPAGTSTLLAGSTSSAPCLPVVSRYLDRRIPPAPGLPLSGSSTSATVTGLSFGNGVYTVATSSTYNTQNPIHAFDGTTTNYLTLGSTTNAADRYSYAIYNGALDFASDGFKGHWVSIVAPSGVSMLPYAVYIKGSVSIDYNPGVYRMYGRRVGSSTWEVLRNESASVTTYNGSAEHLGVISDPAPRAQYYDSFAIEVSQMQGVPSALDVQYGIIYDMYFVGYEVGNCSAGTYAVSNVQCLHCPAGTASSTVGATSNATCATCGTGTYSNGTGAPLCIPCAGGTASASTGASSPSTCQTCGAGTYAAPGSATCTQCPAGTYATSAGSSTCTPCGAGTYSTAVGATASSTCQSCPSGTYSTTVGATASSTCISCPAGTYASSFVVGGKSQNETCFPCGTGTYSTALGALGNATCTNCPIGKFSAVTGASALSMCLACPQGTYADATGTSQCKACPAGTYSTATSATSSSTCQACPAGSYSDPGSNNCTLCPYGTYSTSSGTAQCTQCPQGYNTDQPGATTPTLCNNIVARDPPGSACPAGTYAYSSTQCMGCPIGTYYGGTGAASSSACQSCPTGTYANVTGQSACTQCPAGTASSATKATSVATCAICPAGTYSGVAASSCTNCAAGTYATSAGTSTCTSCAAGTYSTAVGASLASTCQSCVAGTYSTTVGASSSATCQSCVAGTYSTVVGASSSATCQSCAAGTYSTVVGASSSSTCQSCAAGTYSTVVGASSSATCQSCIAGTYSTTVGASSNATCVACIAGTYSTTVGAVSASTCQSCVAGKYSSTVGASSSSTCQSCPAGSYSTVVGANTWLTCQSCVAGTYSGTLAAPSSDYCLQCTSGTYSTSVGATSSATCQPCDAGTYSTVYGAPSSATCTPCRTGTYSAVVGASSSSTCLECPAGTFSNVAGASTWSTCAACPDGSYASTAGSTACTQCVSGSATRLNR